MPEFSPPSEQLTGKRPPLGLARVLLVHDELAPRLALQTILQAGGYSVDVAATSAEALCKLDKGEYELVLTDANFGSGRAGRSVLAYARVKGYRPATAVVNSYEPEPPNLAPGAHEFSVHTENVSALLGDVAELIGIRARRRYRRA
jgi:CheY-like chemotaxis protein